MALVVAIGQSGSKRTGRDNPIKSSKRVPFSRAFIFLVPKEVKQKSFPRTVYNPFTTQQICYNTSMSFEEELRALLGKHEKGLRGVPYIDQEGKIQVRLEAFHVEPDEVPKPKPKKKKK